MDAPKRIWAWKNDAGEFADRSWSDEECQHDRIAEYILATDHARIVAEKDARIAHLAETLNVIEMLTATGDGLSPDEAIDIHILAAEGRFDDPCAWRADPAVIARLRAALKGDDHG